MSPADFKNAWTEIPQYTLIPLSVERFKHIQLRSETKEFLVNAGLPESAAPYLSFVKDTNDIYDGINKLTKQYDFIDPSYEKFIVIGSDGSGNPLAINTAEKDRIELIDHEDFSSSYINASVYHLAGVLLEYRKFVRSLIEENDNGYMKSEFTDEQFMQLENSISEIDSDALRNGNFWKGELDMLKTNREYYRNNPEN